VQQFRQRLNKIHITLRSLLSSHNKYTTSLHNLQILQQFRSPNILTPYELYLIRNPSVLHQHLQALKQENSMDLQRDLIQTHQEFFWKWMKSVADAKENDEVLLRGDHESRNQQKKSRKSFSLNISNSNQLLPELEDLHAQLLDEISTQQQDFTKLSQCWSRLRGVISQDDYQNLKTSLQPLADEICTSFPTLASLYKEVMDTVDFHFDFTGEDLSKEISDKLDSLHLRNLNGNGCDEGAEGSADIALTYVQPEKKSKKPQNLQIPQNITLATQEKARLCEILSEIEDITNMTQQQNRKELINAAEIMLKRRKLKLVEFFPPKHDLL